MVALAVAPVVEGVAIGAGGDEHVRPAIDGLETVETVGPGVIGYDADVRNLIRSQLKQGLNIFPAGDERAPG